MGKGSYFTGQPVYNQIISLLDKVKIVRISRETKGSEAYVKRFDGYQHLIVMLIIAGKKMRIGKSGICILMNATLTS